MTAILVGLIIPLAGTIIGAAFVYTLKDKLSHKLNKLFMGFTSGVMIAAAIWSLLIPAMEAGSGTGVSKVFPAVGGFLCGALFLLLMDFLIPHQHTGDGTSEGYHLRISRTWKLVLAVILHNIPEGMAIGIAFAAADQSNGLLSVPMATALSIGIAIQNIPEGAVVSLPLKSVGNSKNKSFVIGILSGLVQPVAAILTILLSGIIVPVMPFLLAFAAGAMLYVVVEDLIPESAGNSHSNLGPLGFTAGMMIMIILDAALN